jgi:hypothetical protein
MFCKKSSLRHLIATLAVTGCLVAGSSIKSWAQHNTGFTLWSGVARENQLNYYLDYGGQPNGWDRYRFKIPAKKLELGVAQIASTASLTQRELRYVPKTKRYRLQK